MENYEIPVVEIISFESEDIVTASDDTGTPEAGI